MAEWTPGPAWLFCPADRPDRYLKALAIADVVILDLEDAVAPVSKTYARECIVELFESGSFDRERTLVRVNGAETSDHELDLAATTRVAAPRVMLAKAEHPQDVAAIPAGVVALVETARGIESAGVLAEVTNVLGIMWGADDLVAGMGGSSSRRADGRYRDVALFARHRALTAAKACSRLAIDAVHMDIPDADGLAAECEDASAIGFDATVAIHPSQVDVIRRAYRPDPDRVAWAQRLLDATAGNRGVTTFEGRMVDGPVYRQAETILRRAEVPITGNDDRHGRQQGQ